MKNLKSGRIKFKIGDIWESPPLHILVTQEDDIIVARCLDLTVSSHGTNIKDALNSLAESIKEYILTAIENNAVDTVIDPANGKYWRMFNEFETKKTVKKLRQSLEQSTGMIPFKQIEKTPAEISYA